MNSPTSSGIDVVSHLMLAVRQPREKSMRLLGIKPAGAVNVSGLDLRIPAIGIRVLKDAAGGSL